MSPLNLSLKDRVAIVTGASRGIGKAIALALADAGAHVVCASRTVPDLEQTASEIRARGKRAMVVQTDTSIKQDIDNMVAETVREFGTIDILVNNGARGLAIPLMKLREDGWDKLFDVHVKGYFLCAQAAGKVMIERRKGNIINIASMNATLVNPYSGGYCTAKAAEVQLTRTIAGEVGHYGIRCNAIAPGFIKTKMTETMWADPKRVQRWDSIIPAGRFGEPEDVAAVAVFLASDASSYITGATIYVDGGLTLTGYNPEEMGSLMPPHMQL